MSTERPQPQSAGFLAWGSVGALDPEAQRINFSWLVRLRWGAIVGQVAAITLVHYGMDMPLPLPWLALVLSAAVLFNVGCLYCVRVRKARSVSEPMVAAAMAVDVVLLTLLLYFTGGPSNPFSFLYLVHIALAAVVLRSWWTWSLVALSLGCFAALFLEHQLLAPMQDMHAMHTGHAGHAGHTGHTDHAAHMAHASAMSGGHDAGMSLHLQGMWVAFGIAAAFIVYSVSRVTRDLAAREAELMRMRSVASRNESLAALATLAAGAAHELATPLSTIAVAAKELEQSLERSASGQAASTTSEPVWIRSVLEDVRLIRAEVARCRTILQQLSVEAGQSPGEGAVQTQPEELVQLALEGLAERLRIEQTFEPGAGARHMLLPRQAVALALRGLLKNALEASTAPVALHVSASSDACTIEVRDTGPGMAAEVLARVGEPFFTTKPPGQGMGLGVFVARALCEQLGGAVAIDSTQARGTRVRMTLPLELPAHPAHAGLRVQETA